MDSVLQETARLAEALVAARRACWLADRKADLARAEWERAEEARVAAYSALAAARADLEGGAR